MGRSTGRPPPDTAAQSTGTPRANTRAIADRICAAPLLSRCSVPLITGRPGRPASSIVSATGPSSVGCGETSMNTPKPPAARSRTASANAYCLTDVVVPVAGVQFCPVHPPRQRGRVQRHPSRRRADRGEPVRQQAGEFLNPGGVRHEVGLRHAPSQHAPGRQLGLELAERRSGPRTPRRRLACSPPRPTAAPPTASSGPWPVPPA